MKKLTVELPGKQYDIHIGPGLLQQAGEHLAALYPQGRVAVVSDDIVWPLYGAVLEESLRKKGFSPFVTVLPHGESAKSMQTLERLCNTFLSNGLLRNEPVVAFGGGVVGDGSGFAAASYRRGVPFVQIPTTLLAQVDSSVGGKVAVNLPGGKNMAGAFYQPDLVLADTDVLNTLAPRDFASGMAEVIKYAAIASPDLMTTLETAQTRAGMPDGLEDIILTCCKIKAGIVAQDEQDHGVRRILNFGHTFGHAIEKLGGYKRYTHGEAVAIGMVLAAQAGERLGITPAGTETRIAALLKSFSLPIASEYEPGEIVPEMQGDKKNTDGAITLILLEELGRPVIKKYTAKQLLKALER